MTNAVIVFLECKQCGSIAMSFDSDRVIEKAEHHKDEYPEHQLYVHTFKSDSSKKL